MEPVPVTLAVLTWNSPATLEQTLNSYSKFLLPAARELLVYCQELNDAEVAIAERWGARTLGSTENVGIALAYRELRSVAAQPFLLFLECDWRLTSRRVTSVLGDAVRLLEDRLADIVRLRSRRNPGTPIWFLEYQNRELEHPAAVLDSVLWERRPDRVFPEHVERLAGLRHPWYRCSARYAGWTNNPHMARTDWLGEVLDPFSDAAGIQLEHDIETWWSGQTYRVAQGPGLFTHDRRDGPNFVDVPKFQRLRSRARVGTRLRHFRRHGRQQ